MKYLRYKKGSDYSYTIGAYPTIELLQREPDKVRGIFYHAKFASSAVKKMIDDMTVGKNIFCIQDDRLVRKIAGKDNVYLIGVFDKYVRRLEKSEDHVVLFNPSDAGNLGTIMRTMLAMGLKNLAVIEPAVDFWQPEVVRAAMGAIFSLNIERFATIDEYRKKFKGHQILCLMTDGQKKLSEVKIERPASIIFGSESAGLDQDFHQIGQSVRIEQTKEVDSLNLAVATGIVLYCLKHKE